MAYDFSDLSHAQMALLTYQGWHKHATVKLVPKPRASTVKVLLERGLLVLHPIRKGGTDPLAYTVPIDVHIAWCNYCAGSRKG